MTISIYDMDRTITRGGSWMPWLMFWVRREAPWRLLLLPLLGVALSLYGQGAWSRGQLKAAAHRLLMGRRVARARVAAAADAFAGQIIAADVFPAALAAIAADRAAGRRLVLATASNEYYARAIATRLGIADVIATPSAWEGDWLLSRLGGENCYGDAKAHAVALWLERMGLAGSAFHFTSDHESDLPLFELAVANGGEAVAANPSPRLRLEAARRGWRIVDWGPPARSWLERA